MDVRVSLEPLIQDYQAMIYEFKIELGRHRIRIRREITLILRVKGKGSTRRQEEWPGDRNEPKGASRKLKIFFEDLPPLLARKDFQNCILYHITNNQI